MVMRVPHDETLFILLDYWKEKIYIAWFEKWFGSY